MSAVRRSFVSRDRLGNRLVSLLSHFSRVLRAVGMQGPEPRRLAVLQDGGNQAVMRIRNSSGDERVGLIPYPSHTDSVIDVVALIPVAPVNDAYFVRPRSGRLILRYVCEFGVLEATRKVRSRLAERWRNDQHLAVGIGIRRSCSSRNDSWTGFISPAGPYLEDVAVVDSRLLFPLSEVHGDVKHAAEVMLGTTKVAPAEALLALAGWRSESGIALQDADATVSNAKAMLEAARWTSTGWPRRGPASSAAVPRAKSVHQKVGGPTAALFGYGNYAKTVILPSVRGILNVQTVHEIDPTQIPEDPFSTFTTSPSLLPDERPDVVLIASYHHTHAALAGEALRRGASVLCEKPVATSDEALDDLILAITNSSASYFPCYHRRFIPFNSRVKSDLTVGPDGPIHYHCLIYEVPLPERHWYRWPVSRNSIVANGCHWIDHFLFLNSFSPARHLAAKHLSNSTTTAELELENGAEFTMTITDRGADLVGVRDYVEMRSGGATAYLVNGRSYRYERPDRARTLRPIPRLAAHRRMYRELASALVSGAPGESAADVRASASIVLRLAANADA